MKLTDNIIATIRTYTPILAGAIITWLVTLGIEIPAEVVGHLDIALTAIFAAVYYSLARWLGNKYAWAEWLLGYNVEPKYDN